MTKDLEETLDEMGPGYREVVDRLLSAYRPAERPPESMRRERRGHLAGWTISYLAAASLLVFLGLGVVFRSPRAESPKAKVYTVRATTAENEYRLALMRNDAAVQEMIRTQNPDGSWKNDFLTRQNAAALMGRSDPASQVAYKKAVRNLRVRGLL